MKCSCPVLFVPTLLLCTGDEQVELLLAGEKSSKCKKWECIWLVGADIRGKYEGSYVYVFAWYITIMFVLSEK